MKVVPPGGIAGFSQMAPASRMALSKGMGATRTARKTRRRSRGWTDSDVEGSQRGRGVKSHARKAKKSSGLKFGSPAWRKKFMKKKRAGKGRKRRRK